MTWIIHLKAPPVILRFTEDTEGDWRLMHRLADDAEPGVAREIAKTWRAWGQKIDLGLLASDLASFQPPKLDWYDHNQMLEECMGQGLGELARQSALAHLPGLKRQLKGEPETFADPIKDGFFKLDFDLRYLAAEEFIKSYLPQLIVGISQETMKTVQDIVLEGFKIGRHPYEMAEEIKAVVGMLPGQLRAYRAYAQNILKGKLAPERQALLLADFKDRLVVARARNIARTETIRAANAGQSSLWAGAVNHGLMSASTKRRWIATPGERTCPYCRDLWNEQTPLTGTWQSGPFSPTANPPLHPSCRCAQALVFE